MSSEPGFLVAAEMIQKLHDNLSWSWVQVACPTSPDIAGLDLGITGQSPGCNEAGGQAGSSQWFLLA